MLGAEVPRQPVDDREEFADKVIEAQIEAGFAPRTAETAGRTKMSRQRPRSG